MADVVDVLAPGAIGHESPLLTSAGTPVTLALTPWATAPFRLRPRAWRVRIPTEDRELPEGSGTAWPMPATPVACTAGADLVNLSRPWIPPALARLESTQLPGQDPFATKFNHLLGNRSQHVGRHAPG